MFERNKVDNTSTPQQMAVPVELTFEAGAPVRGKLIISASKTLADILNGANVYVEFEPYGGERSYIAKSTLASVKLVNVPKPPVDLDGNRVSNVTLYRNGAWLEFPVP